jgi:FixJ family two-component response regulator
MLVDLNLPEMNGSDLCSLLAASGRDLPAILITGRNDYATRRLIAKEQFIEILFKPVDEQVLLDAIARALAYSYAWFGRSEATQSGYASLNLSSEMTVDSLLTKNSDVSMEGQLWIWRELSQS